MTDVIYSLAAAKVERAIERELIERLRSGAYGDQPMNVEENIWKKVLRGLEREGEGTRDEDLDEGIEEEEELEEEGLGDVEYVSDIEGEEDDDLEEMEDWLEERGEDDDNEEGDSEDEEDSEDGTSEEESGSDEVPTSKKKAPSTGDKRKGPAQPSKPKKKVPRLEIEYENETVPLEREIIRA